jgi:hypothetical protein
MEIQSAANRIRRLHARGQVDILFFLLHFTNERTIGVLQRLSGRLQRGEMCLGRNDVDTELVFLDWSRVPKRPKSRQNRIPTR